MTFKFEMTSFGVTFTVKYFESLFVSPDPRIGDFGS